MWHWHGTGWSWVWMTVVMVGFWAVVVVGIAMLVRSGGERGRTPPIGPSTPEDVLAERFARGEIDVDEYERKREVLDGRRRT
jgi:putative membrane protein